MLLPSSSHKDDILETDLPPRKKLCLTAPTPRFELGESSSAVATRQADHPMSREVGYRITNTWDYKPVYTVLQAYQAQVNTHEILIQTQDTCIGSLETLFATLVAQTSSLQT
ncbi:hypothetical protein Tco_0259434 [Tanacetum coccineum]